MCNKQLLDQAHLSLTTERRDNTMAVYILTNDEWNDLLQCGTIRPYHTLNGKCDIAKYDDAYVLDGEEDFAVCMPDCYLYDKDDNVRPVIAVM